MSVDNKRPLAQAYHFVQDGLNEKGELLKLATRGQPRYAVFHCDRRCSQT